MRSIKYIQLIIFFIAFWLLQVNFVFGTSDEKTVSETPAVKTDVAFLQKLKFYIDLKTQDFLRDLAVQEKQLVQLISSVSAELKKRGLDAINNDDAGFRVVYSEQNKIIQQYNDELNRLVVIYKDLDKLEGLVHRSQDIGLMYEIDNAKSDLIAAVDNGRLRKKGEYTTKVAAEAIEDYTTELDSLLSMYESLDEMRKVAIAQQDTAMLFDVKAQKKQIGRILSQWGPIGPLSDNDYDQYVAEAKKWLGLLRKSVAMEKTHAVSAPAAKDEIEKSQRYILDHLEKEFLSLFLNTGFKSQMSPSVSEFLDEWKAERMADYKARLTQYQLIHQKLVTTAKDRERNRMLGREVGDALLNYANKEYLLADYQLQYLLDTYGQYYKGLDPLIFYQSESKFSQGYIDAATDGYKTIIEKYTGSPFLTESILRMMQITKKFNNRKQFYDYFELMKSYSAKANRQELEAAYYLAANEYFNDRRFRDAEETLQMIPQPSPYYLSAQLLLATVYNNIGNYSKAIPIFTMLSDRKNYPWTGLNTAYIRNSALVRLGLIYYQRGEFEKALDYFQQVSRGYEERDKAMIAAAWAQLKTGRYTQSVERSQALLKEYLASNYTYEALVLAGHCKRIMEQPELAREAMRYVASAHGVLDVNKKYYKERQDLRSQSAELDRIERQVLETRNDSLYADVARLRDTINRTLLSVKQRSDRGSILIQDYSDERKYVVERLMELDKIIELAIKEGREDLAYDAARQRLRLFKVLETFRSDLDVTNASYLVDYPLAAKEAEVLHQKEVVKSMLRDLESEKHRIEKELGDLTALSSESPDYENISSRIDLEMLEYNLNNLRNRTSQLRFWLAENEPEEMVTNFDKWTDYSGLGLTDITHEEIEKRSKRIADLSQNIVAINDMLKKKEKELEAKMAQFDEDFRMFQRALEAEKVKYEKREKSLIFESLYFDEKEKEEESWEARYERLLKQNE